MALGVFWTPENARMTHEVDFWPQFVAGMEYLFEQRNYDGVILGWPVAEERKGLQPDAVIMTKNNIVLVDFKKEGLEGEIVKLPGEDGWTSEPWTVHPVKGTTKTVLRTVKAGDERNKNPFDQLGRQMRHMRSLPGVSEVKTCVLFQGNPTLDGTIPSRYQSFFKIAREASFVEDIDPLLNTKLWKKENDFEELMTHFSVVKYEELRFAFEAKEEMQELRQKVDEIGLQLHKTQTELLELHNQKPNIDEQPAEVRQRIDDLSAAEARQLWLYEIAAERFKAEKAVEAERFKAEAEKYRASYKGQDAKSSKPEEKPSKSKFALPIGAGLVVVAAAVIGWAQNQIAAVPTAQSCVQISDISGSTSCVEFTPLSLGFSGKGNDAYLNDVARGADYKDGKFFVAIPDYERVFNDKAALDAFVGKPLKILGHTEISSDGRFRITVDSADQILAK